MDRNSTAEPGTPDAGAVIYRQSAWTRFTHWSWAICLFFLLLTGLQIFNAHPALYIGDESGFAYDNSVLRIGAEDTASGPTGYTEIFGTRFDTTGVLGVSRSGGELQAKGFPAWATIPSYHDLASGRVVHFFFAWLFAATIAIWLVASLVNRHFSRDILPRGEHIRGLVRDAADHARFRFHRSRTYGPLQRLTYAFVLLGLFPLIIVTGLAMSPGVNAAAPWLPDILGGRQTARTLHFLAMLGLVIFFVVHILMVLAAGPLNELRSIITGWYRVDPPAGGGATR